MSKIIVLGAGMVGSAMAIDLSKNHEVTVSDMNTEVLDKVKAKSNNTLNTLTLDVTDKTALSSAISPFDLVICAVPGFLGFNTLKTIIESGKNVIDISFFPENSLDLDALAKQHNVTAIVDCGVAPGMDNIILGYYNEKLKLTDFECLVGGLPKVKKMPFCYKAPFSPVDVIEEYTRPARYVENGHEVIKPAMSDVEHVQFKEVGTLESFNSDGLRSIIHTMSHIPNMKEKTLRHPGHIDKILTLKEAGFFDTEKIAINGTEVSPLDFTSKVLFKEWKLGETEDEFTIMRITVEGTNENGKKKKVVYTLYDEYDPETQTSSMARSTGYTATAAANLFLEGLFEEKGVFPPELVGKHEACFNYFLKYLKERNVIYKMEEIDL
ncbi:MAG: saccharopine dehydrogenase NADP-binding domain-containing protein [Cyclobacteriaceae bacterium]|nr:saccharopine dehydrogenase NADP-binding domain-containing protein [Cyclobacteriaceae bacterium]